MSHLPLEEGGEMIHAHPPHPDEKKESFPVRLLLPGDGAKKDSLLLLEEGEKQNIRVHHLLEKGDDGLSHRRHEVENVERKGCRPHHHEDALGQVRHLLLLVGQSRPNHRVVVAPTKKIKKNVAALQNQRKELFGEESARRGLDLLQAHQNRLKSHRPNLIQQRSQKHVKINDHRLRLLPLSRHLPRKRLVRLGSLLSNLQETQLEEKERGRNDHGRTRLVGMLGIGSGRLLLGRIRVIGNEANEGRRPCRLLGPKVGDPPKLPLLRLVTKRSLVQSVLLQPRPNPHPRRLQNHTP